jgi:hypothetical protein
MDSDEREDFLCILIKKRQSAEMKEVDGIVALPLIQCQYFIHHMNN